MEIGATLARLELTTEDPAALAAFYSNTFDLQPVRQLDAVVCTGPSRQIVFVQGPGGQLRRATYRFASLADLEAYKLRLRSGGLRPDEPSAHECVAMDPEGRQIAFEYTQDHSELADSKSSLPAARLQHFAIRTPDPEALVTFYVDKLGFVLSDAVRNEAGELTAAFLRTDAEHHSLAIFRAPVSRFDHFSCEATGWPALRDWADHMAQVMVPLAWGIGRHGPGNDTFFMVKDSDGNMAEISSDLEVCSPDRPAGVWPHHPTTLNQWGVAIMRS